MWDDGAVADEGNAAPVDRAIRYDVADPTPAVGGPSLNPPAGQQDQARVEVRDDVLTHTSGALRSPLEIIGVVRAQLRATIADDAGGAGGLLLIRLCDVDERGVSRNVTEGLARLRHRDEPPHGPSRSSWTPPPITSPRATASASTSPPARIPDWSTPRPPPTR